MIVLTLDEIILLHEKLLSATGGTPELRDRGLLESGVSSVNAGFGNVEQCPTIEEKAARLAFALVNNYAFVDGNKRIGVLAIKAFESTAKKYGIDFALKKDAAETPPCYLVFFKGRDADALTAAFKEFSAKKLTQDKKPSIRKALAAFRLLFLLLKTGRALMRDSYSA